MDLEEQYDKLFRYCYFKLCDKQLAQDTRRKPFFAITAEISGSKTARNSPTCIRSPEIYVRMPFAKDRLAAITLKINTWAQTMKWIWWIRHMPGHSTAGRSIRI